MKRSYVTHRCPKCGQTVDVRVDATVTCPHPNRAIREPAVMVPDTKEEAA